MTKKEKLELENGIYEGEVMDGVPHGKGKFDQEELDFEMPKDYYKNDKNFDFDLKTYEGQWHKGVPEGKGKAIKENGTICDGEFHRGLFWNFGKMTFPNGDIYEGKFFEGKRWGEGILKFKSGAKFEGLFRFGFIYKGIIAYPDGTEEEFKFDKEKPPLDHYTYPDGIRYEGEVQNIEPKGQVRPHGYGIISKASGDLLVGQFKEGYFIKGTKIYDKGKKMEGMFNEGKFVKVDESKKNQLMTKNEKIKYVEHYYIPFEFEDYYKGEMKNEKRHGKGTMYYHCFEELKILEEAGVEHYDEDYTEIYGEDSPEMGIYLYKIYVGEWKNDKRHGKGKLIYPHYKKVLEPHDDIIKYVGEWKEDKFHGKGTLTHSDGTKYEGEYKKGKPYGHIACTLPNGVKQLGIYHEGKFLEVEGL